MVFGRRDETPIVRNPAFERVYGLDIGAVDDTLPASKAIRAFQQEILLIRYSYLLSFAQGALMSMVSSFGISESGGAEMRLTSLLVARSGRLG